MLRVYITSSLIPQRINILSDSGSRVWLPSIVELKHFFIVLQRFIRSKGHPKYFLLCFFEPTIISVVVIESFFHLVLGSDGSSR